MTTHRSPPWCWPPARGPACGPTGPSPSTGCAAAPWSSTSSTPWPSWTVDRVVVVVGHRGEWVTKTLVDHAPATLDIEFVEQPDQRGTGDAAGRRPHRAARRDGRRGRRRRGPARRHPAAAARRPWPRWSATTATTTPGPPCSPPRWSTPPATGGWCGAATTWWPGWSRRPTPTTRSGRSLRSTPRSTASGAACWPPRLRRLSPANAQGEYYLTDVVGVLYDAGYRVEALVVADPMEAAGVNDRAQLAVAEAELRDRINERWMRRGVTMWDPERTYVDAEVELAPDVVLLPGVILRGRTTVGEGPRSAPTCTLEDTEVGERAEVRNSVCAGPWSGTGPGWGPTPPRAGDGGRRRRAWSPPFRCAPADRLSRPAPPRAAPGGRRRDAVASGRGADPPPPPGTGVGAVPPGAGPADRPAPRASSWARPTCASSPTARSTAATTSPSGAATSSSSRPTAARSTTR